MHTTYVVSKILAKKGEKPFRDGRKKKKSEYLSMVGGEVLYFLIYKYTWCKENMFPNFMLLELTPEKKKKKNQDYSSHC